MKFNKNDLERIIMALKAFEGKYEKRLNFSKLGAYLEASDKTKSALLDILFQFQDLFKGLFKNHTLMKEIKDNAIYITVQPINPSNGRKNISISKRQIEILNDIIHIFKTIRNRKGFDISKKKTELIKDLTNLYYSFPVLFRKNGHSLIYPTEIAIQLGSKVNEYNRLNVEYTDIEIENYTFLIGKNDRN
jgi:hypothetical protein